MRKLFSNKSSKTTTYILLIYITLTICSCKKEAITSNYEIEWTKFYSFAKLYGYIKHFHPSDEAQEIDWELFAAYGIDKLKQVKTQEELVVKLSDLFHPIAPGLKISIGKPTNYNILEISPSTVKNLDTISWQHYGYGNGAFNTYYRSTRTNRPMRLSFIKESSQNSLKFKNSTFKGDSIKVELHTKLINPDWNTSSNFNLMAESQFISNSIKINPNQTDWRKVVLKSSTSQKTSNLSLEINLKHAGNLLVDNIKLYEFINSNWLLVEKLSFEEKELIDFNVSNENAFYLARINNDEGYKSNSSLNILSAKRNTITKSLFEEKSKFGDYYTAEIGNDIFVQFPLALLGDSIATYPKIKETTLGSLKSDLFEYGLNQFKNDSEVTKLGILISAWNVLQHFYPYHKETYNNWDQVLIDLISNNSKHTTIELLQVLLSKLNDGHGRIEKANTETSQNYFFPVFFQSLGDQVVITSVANDTLDYLKYSSILAINNVTIDKYLKDKARFLTGSRQRLRMKDAVVQSLLIRKSDSLYSFKVKLLNGNLFHIDLNSNLNVQEFFKFYPKSEESDVISFINKEITYINLGQVTYKQFTDNIDIILKTKAIVIDSRSSLNNDAKKLLSHFIQQDDTINWLLMPKILKPDNSTPLYFKKSGWKLKPQSQTYSGSIYYLIDSDIMSYGESIGAYFEAMPNATLIGDTTAGTNGSINGTYLLNGISFAWTGMKVLKHDGSQLHGIGIIPDIHVERTPEGIAAGRDEVLEKAIELATAYTDSLSNVK